jgi:hypothetical protein
MANEPQEKQSQYASFSFGILGVVYQQLSPRGLVMACPPWSPPESVLWKHLKLLMVHCRHPVGNPKKKV